MIDMFTGAIVASWSHMVAQIITRPVDMYLALPPRPFSTLRLPIRKTLSASPKLSSSMPGAETTDSIGVRASEKVTDSKVVQDGELGAMAPLPVADHETSLPPAGDDGRTPLNRSPARQPESDTVLELIKPSIEC